MTKEIERKFLLTKPLPEADVVSYSEIVQGYVKPDSKVTMRIRIQQVFVRHGTKFIPQSDGPLAIFTLKDKQKGEDPDEEEMILPYYMGQRLLEDCGDCVIKKERYDVIYGHGDTTLAWEVDVFKKKLKGLVIAEIEIPNRDQKIIVPSWLGTEVTDDKRYKNKRLAVAQEIPEGYKSYKV